MKVKLTFEFFKNILSINFEFMTKLLGLLKLWIDYYFFELWGVTSQILVILFMKCNISNVEKQIIYIVKHKPSHQLEKLFDTISKDLKLTPHLFTCVQINILNNICNILNKVFNIKSLFIVCHLKKIIYIYIYIYYNHTFQIKLNI